MIILYKTIQFYYNGIGHKYELSLYLICLNNLLHNNTINFGDRSLIDNATTNRFSNMIVRSPIDDVFSSC